MKLLKIIVFSVLEALTIGLLWEFFADKGHLVLASILAFGFLTLEHIMARNTANGLGLFANLGERLGLQLILGVTEIVFWDVWRLIHEDVKAVPGFGPVLAVIVFALLLIPQHNAENNVNTKAGFFVRLFRSQGVTISLIEAVTAMGWLLAEDIGTGHIFLALIPLVVGLTAEHVVREFGEPHGANF